MSHQDIAAVESFTVRHSVAVLLGNGDGTFQTASTYLTGGIEALFLAVAAISEDCGPPTTLT